MLLLKAVTIPGQSEIASIAVTIIAVACIIYTAFPGLLSSEKINLASCDAEKYLTIRSIGYLI